ncbi:IclR family transcriptional regulator [Acidovorax carolinensis]|uniref:IclR family transcriptional regulator n=1 Tax=Acidovorax carolinensis TaxID=553814 RepID=UPI000B34342F|nr:IclR family transcriptional regulator [Acidovorax carolinensis]ART49487.1 IclR family transcriptional regulator [Acidovorax carolinensis]
MPTSTRPKAVITHERGATSSVERALRVLRVMSEGGSVRLTDIASAADLDKATALRLLDVMAREGFVKRDAQSKQFTLGPELTVLGAAALRRFDPRPLARPSLMRLAGVFQDSVVLSIRSGVESLCIDVEEGTYPIRANYLTVGSRRPLGVGAGSLALLASMPDDEREAALETLSGQLERYPRISPALLRERIDQARERGYAVLLDVVVERMGGIGAAILDPEGRPVAALSIASLNDRVLTRETALAHALLHEATVCQVRWAEATRAHRRPASPLKETSQ